MFYGADTEQLHQWTEHAENGVVGLRDRIAPTLLRAHHVNWVGTDAEEFRSVVLHCQDNLLATITLLNSLAIEGRAHAKAQDQASAAHDGAEQIGDLAPQARDQEGDPDDGPGEYIPYLPPEDEWTPEEAERFAEQWIDPDMIMQGQVGDCGLMASLMAIAQHDPDLIRENLVRNPDGTWTVTLYKDGVPVPITVESTLPEHGAKSIVPADLDGDGEYDEYAIYNSWVSIYEKAVAEYTSEYGDSSYAELDNGGYGDEYMSILTGNEAQRTGDSDFADIATRLEDGPVTATTEMPREWWRLSNEVDDPTIVPNHEYNVQQIIPAGTPAPDGSVSDQDRIHLDNPWGPEGGDGKVGDLYLTEQEYKDNFRAVSSVPLP